MVPIHALPAAQRIQQPQRGLASSRWDVIASSLDAALCTVPASIVAVALIYASLPAEFLSMGVLSTLLALAMVHCVSAATHRPMAYSARFFEATTLAAMLLSFAQRLPGWGLEGSPAQILAVLCSLGALSGLFCAVLYALGADRFTRLIPSPVYAGFAISIALLLMLSQSTNLYQLWRQGSPWQVLLSLGAVSMGVALLVRRFKPNWPSTAAGIASGSAVALLWMVLGQPVEMLLPQGQIWALPWQVADFAGLFVNSDHRMSLLASLASNAALLGIMIFINMTVASEAVSQTDDRYASRVQSAGLAMVLGLCGAAGSAPIAASTQSSNAAMRSGALTAGKSAAIGIVCLLMACLSVANVMAAAAVSAVMLVDAYFLADRGAVMQAWGWLRGKALQTQQKQDLGLVALVTFVAVAFNVVSAIFMGLLFGLILFAMRNAIKPVRFIWTGAQLHSNCARGRAEMAVLAAQGQRIRVVELEGDLFFGSVAALDDYLKQSLVGAHSVILDWQRVRNVESSIALAISRWSRLAQSSQVRCLHAGAQLQSGQAQEFLLHHFPDALLYPDLDRALEAAESMLIAGAGKNNEHLTTQLADALFIFRGLSLEQRKHLDSLLPQRFFKARDTIFSAGEASDHLLIVLQGSAGVIVRGENGREMRIISVRRGGVLGEIGFLDQSPRSADVVAQEDVLAAVLTREVFDGLQKQEPQIVMLLLANLAVDLSARLRYTNKLALARSNSF